MVLLARLDEFVTTDSNAACDKIIAEALAIADRLRNAQVGLAEAVYRREWNEDWAPLLSCVIPGTRSGGLAGCRFEHPDEHSNGPMSSLRLRMNLHPTEWPKRLHGGDRLVCNDQSGENVLHKGGTGTSSGRTSPMPRRMSRTTW